MRLLSLSIQIIHTNEYLYNTFNVCLVIFSSASKNIPYHSVDFIPKSYTQESVYNVDKYNKYPIFQELIVDNSVSNPL